MFGGGRQVLWLRIVGGPGYPSAFVRLRWCGPVPLLGTRSPEVDRPEKITFAEMRDMGVRGLLVFCADYRCATRSPSAATAGPMMSGCPTSSLSSFARPAASAAPTSGGTSTGTGSREPRWGGLSVGFAIRPRLPSTAHRNSRSVSTGRRRRNISAANITAFNTRTYLKIADEWRSAITKG
jgi:hypothetical protein